MGSNCLMDGYQYKTLIKHLIKSNMRISDQQKQLFYGLSVHLRAPVCFSREQLKDKVILTDTILYCYCDRDDRCFIISTSLANIERLTITKLWRKKK